jgi:alpha-L-arabinofuranosidase
MRKFTLLFLILLSGTKIVHSSSERVTGTADSVYLASYGINGLQFAWSHDKKNWSSVAKGHVFLRSDFGGFGSDKKMVTPDLIMGRNGVWQCVWSLNNKVKQFAHAESKDLIRWGAQNYPRVDKGVNVIKPLIIYQNSSDRYQITYLDKEGKYYQTYTKDFKSFTGIEQVPAEQYISKNVSFDLSNVKLTGQIHRVHWNTVEKLTEAYQLRLDKDIQDNESTKDDGLRFQNTGVPELKLKAEPGSAKAISKLLTGVFFEDINYAADGGLYAELIQNRGFEYKSSDKENKDKNWNSFHSWILKGKNTSFNIDSLNPFHPNNPRYALLKVDAPGASLSNAGFDGIAVKKGHKYIISLAVKTFLGKGSFEVRLVSTTQGTLARSVLNQRSATWKQLTSVLQPSMSATDVSLELAPLNKGTIAFDMVSLFPEKTFKNRKNGMREDLAQAIADIRPKFIRFPGGCVAHGDGIHNIYKWKNTIGPLEARIPDRNLWGYHQSMGLGFFEYFQFCEDIGAAPVPVIAAGVPCQNSGYGDGGQQGGIPMSEMPAYIQDIIDLVEYANGDVDTKWGKVRAAAGHPKPFNLKYIGIGNEDQISDVFRERFVMIFKALQKACPEIILIGTSGPWFEGTDYEEGWKLADSLKLDMVDEHYYRTPGWFINNQDFYDKYDRTKSKIYLGEYAASLNAENRTNLEASLSEAIYLTSLERNGDVVSMASYAPLLAKEGHTQWSPDLIYFTNTEVKPTIGYYVQQLYGQNAGDEYIPAKVEISLKQDNAIKRVSHSITRNSKTGEVYIKLVNLLPVAVKTVIDISELNLSSKNVLKKEIAGQPNDTKLTSVQSTVSIAELQGFDLKPYSFTVLKL